MIKKFLTGVLMLMLAINLSGCIALLAGAGGTALWQLGKVVSEEASSMNHAVTATEKAFQAKKISLTEKVSKNETTQLRGRNQEDKKVAVDIITKGAENVKIEIRIGIGEEQPARELLTKIKKYL